MGFDFAQMLPLAGALALTSMSGGAAAPALAAAEGATAAGTAGALDAAVAGTGLAAETGAASSALGATTAAPGVAAAPELTAGAAAPTGQASILNPLAPSMPPPQLGSGISGAANPFAPQGSLMGGQPQLPMGMTSQPLSSSAPLAGPAPGSGLSGSGAFQTMPAGPVEASGMSMPNAQQIQGMKTAAGQLAGGEQRPSAPPSAGAGPRGSSNLQMGTVSAPAVGARPSLAQLLYGRR